MVSMQPSYATHRHPPCRQLSASCLILSSCGGSAKLRTMDLTAVAELATQLLPGAGTQYARPVQRLAVFRQHRPSAFEAGIFEPVIILILQGRKETVLGEDSFP